MVKYRRLRMDELEKLEQEFIRFLAAQSITAEDYRKIQKSDPRKQLELIDHFSDVVFIKTLSNIKILEQKTPKRLIYYTFFENHAELHGFELEEASDFDLESISDPAQIISFINDNHIYINWLKGSKPYTSDRNSEIFLVLEKQCSIVQHDTLYQFIRQKFDNPA